MNRKQLAIAFLLFTPFWLLPLFCIFLALLPPPISVGDVLFWFFSYLFVSMACSFAGLILAISITDQSPRMKILAVTALVLNLAMFAGFALLL